MTFPQLITAYLQSLEGRPSWARTYRVAQQWILTLLAPPTRAELLTRQRTVCAGHYQPGATKANKELALIRAACNWGLYQERWDGGNPTLGIRKFKTSKRTRIGKLDELRTIVHALDFADSDLDKRDRALIGVMLFTGCRPGEARCMTRESVTAYGTMGSWQKGRTKNGQSQDLPLPRQVMAWLAEVPAHGAYYFSHTQGIPLSEATVRVQWRRFCHGLTITGLWSYDLRRTLATYLQTELKQSDSTVQAILNHYDGRALAHYVHPPFDFLATVIQSYADWLWSLKGETPMPKQPACAHTSEPSTVSSLTGLVSVILCLTLSACGVHHGQRPETVMVTDGFHIRLPVQGSHMYFPGLYVRSPGLVETYSQESRAREAIVTWMQKRGVIFVAPRTEREQYTKEQEFKLRHDNQATARVGQMKGADTMLVVNIENHPLNPPVVSITATDVDSGEIVWAGAGRIPPDPNVCANADVKAYSHTKDMDAQTIYLLTCRALATAFGTIPPGRYPTMLDETCPD